MLKSACFGWSRFLSVTLLVSCYLISSGPVRAQERLCDSSFEDCRTPIWNLIKNEQQEIDVAFWFMQDTSYANLIINRFNAGVKVRVIVDPRANSAEAGNQQILNQLSAAGIPMRYKVADCILHWKMMLFAGQNTVQFSGADYGPFFFVPATPYQNYIDESIYFSTDPAIVDSFQTQYDNLWTDTVNYGNYANISGSLTRSYPTSPISPDMNFPPDNTNPLNDFGSRTVDVMSQEKQKIDAEIYRITNTMFTNAAINAVRRGVPTRLLTEPEEYRNPARVWDSYNVDLMYMGGVQVKQTKHQGLNHQKSMLLYGQGMTVWGSSNWTGPSADCQAEHNYFNTSKPWFFKWFQNQFERKWNSAVEYEPFIPLPPDAAANFAPANNATGQPLTVTLTWDGGPWSQKFDIYFGTTATPPLVASDVLTGDPTVLNSRVFQVSGLLPNTTYHWQVVDKTMANLTAAGPVWSFTTGAGPTPTSTPSITTLSPASAGTAGGAQVNIGGSGFASGAAVVVGNVLATNVSVASATAVSAAVPPHAAGSFDVLVINPDGGTASLPGAFTYVAPPAPGPHANLVAPSSGPPAGGANVTITGYNFSPSASVTIGGASAAAVSVSNGVAITATTPSGALGSADVVVKNPDGQSSTLLGAYTYANPAPAPQISSISPSTGPSTGSTQVTITGSGFQYGATVTFGSTPATTMIVYGPTTITAYAPPGSDGPVNVVVTNYDGQTATLTNGFTYSGSVAPGITSISPTSGTTAGGTFVEIDGTGFTSGTSVTMGGSAASVVSTASTKIVVTTPAHSASAADVIVSNASGQGILSGGYTYITNAPPPTVSTVSPASGASGGGTSVSITGTGFTAGATVSFGGVAATAVTATSSTSIEATAPAHAPAVVDVVVTNTDGQSATLTGGFTYSQGSGESLLLADNFDSNSINPANWSIGNLFSGTTDTTVGMADASQQLQIGPLDQNATGSHYNGLRSAATYNFTGAYCSVELVTPPSANTLADAMLTIGTDVNDYYRIYVEGGNLIGQRKAAGTKATLFTQAYDPVNDKYIRIRHNSTSGTAIFEVAPDNSGTPGTWSTIFSELWNSSIPLTGTIFEIKAGTWQAESNAPGTVVFDNFRAAVPAPPAPAPTVSSVSPTSGSASGGTSVTVTGSGFQPGASLTFGGTQASAITVNNSTSITATTPAHAMGAVDLVVTNSDGQTGTLTGGFSYTASAPAPAVSSVSPSSGSTAGGTGITITGTGFATGATIMIGGAAATNVTVSNSTSINAMTPAHSSGAMNVAVTNPDGQTGSLSSGFTYVNPAPTVSAASPTSGSSAGGTTVVVTGTGFMAGATVAFGGTPATGVTVNSGTSITATTGAHAVGAVDVVVTNSDGQHGTLSSGFTYSSAPGETVLLADDFSSNQIDSTKWSSNSLFSGFTDTSVPMTVSNQQLLIGPLDVNTSGSHYNGLRSAGTFNFTGAYSYVELVTPPGSNGAGDAMLTVGTDVNDFYRVYIESGTLVCQRKAAGAKATLLTQNYDPVNDKYLRIRHDAATGAAIFEVAPDGGGVPGAWTTIYSEQWNSSIPLTRIIFEIKAGTWEAEPNAPGTVVFDNFRAAVPQ